MAATTGTVVALLTAPSAGVAMRSHAAVHLVPGVGIPGDRYATGLGHWSDPRWPDQELTLVEAELAEELGLAHDQLRRNIVTRGVDLSTLVGRQFWLGDALVRGVRPCDPCRYIEGLVRPGLFRDLAGRGGLRAAILSAGQVRLGDPLLLDATGSSFDAPCLPPRAPAG